MYKVHSKCFILWTILTDAASRVYSISSTCKTLVAFGGMMKCSPPRFGAWMEMMFGISGCAWFSCPRHAQHHTELNHVPFSVSYLTPQEFLPLVRPDFNQTKLTYLWTKFLHHVTEKFVKLFALNVAIICRRKETKEKVKRSNDLHFYFITNNQ